MYVKDTMLDLQNPSDGVSREIAPVEGGGAMRVKLMVWILFSDTFEGAKVHLGSRTNGTRSCEYDRALNAKSGCRRLMIFLGQNFSKQKMCLLGTRAAFTSMQHPWQQRKQKTNYRMFLHFSVTTDFITIATNRSYSSRLAIPKRELHIMASHVRLHEVNQVLIRFMRKHLYHQYFTRMLFSVHPLSIYHFRFFPQSITTVSHLSISKTKQKRPAYNFNCLTPLCLRWTCNEWEITCQDSSVWKTNCKTLHHLNTDWMPAISMWERVCCCTSHIQFPPRAIIATKIALKCLYSTVLVLKG